MNTQTTTPKEINAMAKKTYSGGDHSTEAWRAREEIRQEHIRNGEQAPAALLEQLSKDADAAMERAIAKYGRD